jgi:hypothetical protein
MGTIGKYIIDNQTGSVYEFWNGAYWFCGKFSQFGITAKMPEKEQIKKIDKEMKERGEL